MKTNKLELYVSMLKSSGVLMASGIIITTLAAFGAPAKAANLVLDGSFEATPVTSSDGYQTYYSGDTFGPWSVDSGSVDLVGKYWQAEDGTNSVDMSGYAPGTISQTIATTQGHVYDLSFWISGNPDGPPPTKYVDTEIGGTSLGQATYTIGGNTHSAMNWEEVKYIFTAQSSDQTLSFIEKDASEEGGSPFGLALDNVSVQPAPEASSVLAMGLPIAFGALFLGLKRRGSHTASKL